MSRKALRDFYRLQQQQGDFFEPEEFVRRAGAADLVDLVRAHRELLAEKQVLDSEQKALIYNNYKKLIEASDQLDGIDAHSARIVKTAASIDKIGELNVARGPGQVSDFAARRAAFKEAHGLTEAAPGS